MTLALTAFAVAIVTGVVTVNTIVSHERTARRAEDAKHRARSTEARRRWRENGPITVSGDVDQWMADVLRYQAVSAERKRNALPTYFEVADTVVEEDVNKTASMWA